MFRAQKGGIMFRCGRVLVAALFGGSLLVPAAQAGAAAQNNWLLFYRSTPAPTAFRATDSAGVYTPKGSTTFVPKGVTKIAISRDSMLMYDRTTGVGITGTFKAGVFTKKHTYTFAKNIRSIAAGCNTAALLQPDDADVMLGSLVNGAFVFTGTFGSSVVTQLVASCDTVLGYNQVTGDGYAVKVSNGNPIGRHPTNYTFSTGWSSIAATDDSVLFYNETNGVGAWGTLQGGQFAQTGSSAGFATGISAIGADANSLFFYSRGSAVGATATLAAGYYAFAHQYSGLAANWDLILGGK